MAAFPIDRIRAQFPALGVPGTSGPRTYLDAPGGTQACTQAIETMTAHLMHGTANSGGTFATSRETDAMSRAAHQAMADLLGGSAQEIAFGPNMTSLTLALSRALAQGWNEGDELVLTRLDHDANVTPWLLVARDRGMAVRWIDLDPVSGTLRLDTLPDLLNARTRLVAVGAASNALGTLNDVAEVVRLVREHSTALIFVDAVQSVPHIPTDVAALGCDFLACSPYKFFGPHQGVLWGRADRMEALQAYKLRPSPTQPPAVRLETGTPSFEGQAGVLGTIDYLEWLGRAVSPDAPDRRTRLVAAMEASIAYEHMLGERFLAGLAAIPGACLYGPPTMAGRVPTFGFTLADHHPADIASALAARDIFTWAGHFYAVEPMARLGLAEAGGLLRIGLCHYNTAEEVDRTLAALADITT